MDIGMREILIIMGCVIMAVLFFDAYRRVRDHRRSQFGHRLHERPESMSPSTLAGFDDDEKLDDDEHLTPVRPVGQSSGRIGQGHLKQSAHREEETAPQSPVSQTRTGQSQSAQQASSPKQIRVRISTPKNAEPAKRGKEKDDLFPGLQQSRKSDAPMKALLQPALASTPEAGDFYSSRRNSTAAMTARKAQAEKMAVEPSAQSENKPEAKSQQSQPEEVIIMHVAAGQDEVFDGEVLVHQLLALNMRHGDLKIFHRYERPEQHQGLLFSMANMVKPGYFELDHMNAFDTPGVTFFLTLPCAGGALYAFDLMVDTARKLSRALDGELRDESQSMITAQTVEHYRQRVMEFERKQRMLEKTRQIRERNKLFD